MIINRAIGKLIGKYFQISLTVTAFFFIYSCKDTDYTMTPNNEIVFSFQPNQSYKFDINETSQIHNTIGKEKTSNSFSTHLNLLYRILDSNQRANNVLVQFSKADMYNEIQGANEVDTVHPFNEGLKAFDGATFNITLSPSGEVTSISGYDDFKESFTSLYNAAATGENELHQVPVIEEVFFTDIFDHISNILCARTVGIDSTWEKLEAEDIGGDKEIINVYRCDKIQNGIAYISSSKPIEKVIASHNSTMKLQGLVQGEYELEANTGILVKGKRSINMSGNIKLNGIDFGMTICKTITINGKRVTDIATR